MFVLLLSYIEVKALLLSDILVLLHNQEDTDKVILKQYHIEPIGVGEVREEISPIIRVKEMILRHYATDKGNNNNNNNNNNNSDDDDDYDYDYIIIELFFLFILIRWAVILGC